jgi:hypothetical protein
MIPSRLLLLVLSLYSASVLAQNYDGTRIANRTIERVRPDIPLLDKYKLKELSWLFSPCRPFSYGPILYLRHTLTRTSKIGTLQPEASTTSLSSNCCIPDDPPFSSDGGTLVQMRMWCVQYVSWPHLFLEKPLKSS